MLRGFGTREMMEPEGKSSAAGGPADGVNRGESTPAEEAIPADSAIRRSANAAVVEVADETTQPADRVEESAVVGEGDEGDDEHDNEDTEPLSVAELEQEIAKLRRQSARRRIERNHARDEVTQLRARVGEL